MWLALNNAEGGMPATSVHTSEAWWQACLLRSASPGMALLVALL